MRPAVPDPALLALADGTVYRGRAFGARGVGAGEAVFNTSITGYQEILTDPSYAGQIVVMTYTQIGNVGVNPEDEESDGLHLRGFIVRNHVDYPSSWRARESLQSYLERHGVPGIEGIDTRALVRHIRTAGAMNGVVIQGDPDFAAATERARALPSMSGRNLVDEVTCSEPYRWTEGRSFDPAPGERPGESFRVLAYDYGLKRNILRELVDQGLEPTVVPADTPVEDALAFEPDGVFLSNGPGDPRAVEYARPIVREWVERGVPLFGICVSSASVGGESPVSLSTCPVVGSVTLKVAIIEAPL